MSSFLKMPRLSHDQRTWVCLEITCVQNATGVIRCWPARWPNIPPPTGKIRTETPQTYTPDKNLPDETPQAKKPPDKNPPEQIL